MTEHFPGIILKVLATLMTFFTQGQKVFWKDIPRILLVNAMVDLKRLICAGAIQTLPPVTLHHFKAFFLPPWIFELL